MSQRTKPANFDGQLLPEAAPQRDAREKTAAVVPGQQAADVDREHRDARTRDATLEQIRGLTRASRDRDRAYPRPAGQVNPRKTAAPGAAGQRTPPSDYQCRARSQTKRAAQSRLRRTEYDALGRLITDQDHWVALNERLADNYTSGAGLPPNDRLHVQRIDRAIRRFEEINDRGHLVYAPLSVSGLDGPDDDTAEWVRDHVSVGDRYTFDQFTAADHDPGKAAAHRAPVLLEISTGRGMYLGGPAAGGNTSHLLPRGLHLEVVGVTTGTVEGPDGQQLSTPIISLRALQEEETHGLHRQPGTT